MLFRWFVGLSIDEKVFDASTFSKNRDRLLTHEIAQGFLASLLALPEVKGLMSADHFSVDGTLLKAWASMKSFRPKDGSGEPPTPGRNGETDFRKTKRSNETHASTTDKDARLFRKGDGQESCLSYLGHALMENRNGLVVGAEATLATRTAEREAAAALSERLTNADIDHLSVEPNDFAKFFADHPRIQAVGFNGKKAADLYRRKVLAGSSHAFASLQRVTLPSTSSAHARIPFDEKVSLWRSSLAPWIALRGGGA